MIEFINYSWDFCGPFSSLIHYEVRKYLNKYCQNWSSKNVTTKNLGRNRNSVSQMQLLVPAWGSKAKFPRHITLLRGLIHSVLKSAERSLFLISSQMLCTPLSHPCMCMSHMNLEEGKISFWVRKMHWKFIYGVCLLLLLPSLKYVCGVNTVQFVLYKVLYIFWGIQIASINTVDAWFDHWAPCYMLENIN